MTIPAMIQATNQATLERKLRSHPEVVFEGVVENLRVEPRIDELTHEEPIPESIPADTETEQASAVTVTPARCARSATTRPTEEGRHEAGNAEDHDEALGSADPSVKSPSRVPIPAARISAATNQLPGPATSSRERSLPGRHRSAPSRGGAGSCPGIRVGECVMVAPCGVGFGRWTAHCVSDLTLFARGVFICQDITD